MTMKRKRIHLLFLCGSLLFNVACQLGSDPASQETESPDAFQLNEELKKTTKLIPIEQMPVEEELTLSGKIVYNQNDLIIFRSLLEGVIESVNFEVGDFIKKGNILAVVRSPEAQELNQRQSLLTKQVRLLETSVQNKRDMAKDGLISDPELLSAEHELDAALIELEGIRNTLDLYQAQPDGNFQILAPKDGYIIQKSISPGQNITDDSPPLFAISNLDKVWAMVNIYASNLRHINEGDQVSVRTLAFPDQLYEGTIDKIHHVFDDDEHVLKARVVLDNKQLRLMPGLGADITIHLRNTHQKALAIPNEAKVFHNDCEYLIVQTEDSSLEIREISPIASNDKFTYIKDGVSREERLVVSNVLLIFEQLNQ